MALCFKLAEVADAAVVAQLVDDMDVHYRGDGNTVGVAAAIPMIEATIREREGTRFLLALDGDVAVGIACFAVLRPGFRQQGLVFLKDLFVPAHLRGRGIGGAITAELARFAIAHGIGRIDLTADADNAKAAALYDSLGAERQEKIMFRYDGEALRKLAAKGER